MSSKFSLQSSQSACKSRFFRDNQFILLQISTQKTPRKWILFESSPGFNAVRLHYCPTDRASWLFAVWLLFFPLIVFRILCVPLVLWCLTLSWSFLVTSQVLWLPADFITIAGSLADVLNQGVCNGLWICGTLSLSWSVPSFLTNSFRCPVDWCLPLLPPFGFVLCSFVNYILTEHCYFVNY